MPQWLRAPPATLLENLGSNPSTHEVAHNYLQLQFKGASTLFWPLSGVYVEHKYACRQSTHTQIAFKNKIQRR